MNEELLQLVYSKFKTDATYDQFKADIQANDDLKKAAYGKLSTDVDYDTFVKDLFGDATPDAQNDAVSDAPREGTPPMLKKKEDTESTSGVGSSVSPETKPVVSEINIPAVDPEMQGAFDNYMKAKDLSSKQVQEIEDYQKGDRSWYEHAKAYVKGYLSSGGRTAVPIYNFDSTEELVKKKQQYNAIEYLEDLPEQDKAKLYDAVREGAYKLDKDSEGVLINMRSLEARATQIAASLKPFEGLSKEELQKLPDEEKERLRSSLNALQEIQEAYNDNFDVLEKTSEEIGTFQQEIDLLKRNYDGLDNFIGRVVLTTKDLAAGALEVMASMPTPAGYSPASAQGLSDFAQEIKEESGEQRDLLRPEKEIGDIQSPEDFGEWIADLTANQLPIITTILATGGTTGAAILGTSAGGQKSLDMKSEMDRGEAQYTKGQIFLASVGSGLAEFGSEYVTGGILSKGKRTLKAAVTGAGEESFRKGFANRWASYSKDVLSESTSEGIAQLSNNIIDKVYLGKDISLTDGLENAIASGGFMGAAMSFAPTVVGSISDGFHKRKASLKIKENTKKLQSIMETLEEGNLDPEVEAELIKTANSLMNESGELFTETHDNMESMDTEEIKKISKINEDLKKERAKAKKIVKNPEIDQPIRETISERMLARIQGLEKDKEETISTETNVDPEGNPKKELSKFMSKYRRKRKSLARKLDAGRITRDEFNFEKSKLNKELTKVQKDLGLKNEDVDLVSRDTKWDEDTKEGLPKSRIRNSRTLKERLKTTNWGLLTAENPNAEQVSDQANAEATKKAEQWLKDKGYKPTRIFGKYGNSENSFYVPGLSIKDAVEFAREFDQESVATSDGLVYQDNTFNPREGDIEVDVEDASDFYSTIKTGEGNVNFKVNYNFDRKHILDPSDMGPRNVSVSVSTFDELVRIQQELFGLDQSQAQAAAAITDRMVGQMAKREGISKEEMYSKIQFKKSEKAPDGSLKQEPTLFRSNALESLAMVNQSKATKEQWMAMLSKGVKGTSQEIDWIGLEDFLFLEETNREAEGLGKSIPKEVVEDYIRTNQYPISEVVLGMSKEFEEIKKKLEAKRVEYKDARDAAYSYYNSTHDTPQFDNSKWEDLIDKREKLKDEYDELEAKHGVLYNNTSRGKYEQWTLSGGENYREILLTVGQSDEIKAEIRKQLRAAHQKSNSFFDNYGEEFKNLKLKKNLGIIKEKEFDRLFELKEERNSIEKEIGSLEKQLEEGSEILYESSHFEQKNILVHARVKDRILPSTGEKVLFIEEIQSDWAQAGRKEGFATEEAKANLKRAEKLLKNAKDAKLRSKKFLEGTKPTLDKNSEKFRDSNGLPYFWENSKRTDNKTVIYKPMNKFGLPMGEKGDAHVVQEGDTYKIVGTPRTPGYSFRFKEDAIRNIEEISKTRDYSSKVLEDPNNLPVEAKEALRYFEAWSKSNNKIMEPVNEAIASGLVKHGDGGNLVINRSDPRLADGDGVANMPYQKTEQWMGLALRKLFKEAANKSYDRVAWITGEQTADRYNLSKHYKNVNVTLQSNGRYGLSAINESGIEVVNQGGLSKDRVIDYIGEQNANIAFKNIDGKKEGTSYDITNVQVGGEGHKKFYNQIFPRVARKEAQRFDKKAKVDVVDFKALPELKNYKLLYSETFEMWFLEDKEGNRIKEPLTGSDIAFGDKKYAEVFAANYDSTSSYALAKQATNDELLYGEKDSGVGQQLSIPVTEEMRRNLKGAAPLFQNAQGAMLAEDGNFIVYALTNPNVSTPLHEMAHVYEHYLTEQEKADVIKWAGTNEWTTETSEKFARGFEKYLSDGNAPTSKLQKVFDKFRQWLKDIYNSIKGSEIDIELSDRMKEIYSEMLGVRVAEKKMPKGLNKLYDALDKLDQDLDNFGRGTLGINLPVAVAKVVVKALKGAVKAGMSVQQVIDAGVKALQGTKWYSKLDSAEKKAAEAEVGYIVQDNRPVNKPYEPSNPTPAGFTTHLKRLFQGFPILSYIDEVVFSRYIGKPLERTITKIMKRGDNSRSAVARNVTKTVTSFYNGAIRTEDETRAARTMAGHQELAVERGQRIAKELHRLIDHNPESARRVHQVMDPELYPNEPLSYDDLNQSEKELHDLLKEINQQTHEMNFKLGFIDEETFDKFDGKYIGRGYEVYEDAKIDKGIFQYLDNKILGDIYRRRQDVDEWKIDNKIEDPIYLTLNRMIQTERNAAVYNYALYIKESGIASKEEKPGYYQLSGKAYGPLKGMWVPHHIAEDFKGYFFTTQLMDGMYSAFKAYDKLGFRQFLKRLHTVYSGTVQVGNFMSNHAFAFASGINIVQLWSELAILTANKKSYQETYDLLLGEGIVGSNILTPDLKLSDEAQKRLKTGALNFIKKADKRARDVYAGSDNIMKMAAYKALRRMDYTHEQAVQRVYEGFQNYSTVGKIWDLASKTPVIGNAYIKFQADLQRIMKNAVLNRPLTTASFLGSLYFIAQFASMASGESEEERAIREGRPFIPKIKMPFSDLEIPLVVRVGDKEINLARYISPYYNYDVPNSHWLEKVSRFTPYGVIVTEAKELGQEDKRPQAPDVLFGPFMQAFMYNKDFRQRSITDPYATRFKESGNTDMDKFVNQLEYVSRSIVPLFSTAQDLYLSREYGRDFYGRTKSRSDILISKVIKIQTWDDESTKDAVINAVNSIQYEADAINKRLKAVERKFQNEAADQYERYRRGRISKKQFEQFVADQQQKSIKRANKHLEDLVKQQEKMNQLVERVEKLNL